MSNTENAPKLRQSVQWGERYVSSALNKKFAGILPAGIYQGFRVRPGGQMRVLVGHDTGREFSVAIVERNTYSLTVAMDDPGYVDIPAPGTWYIVLEAFYIETQPGYQYVVAREEVLPYHVVLGKVTVPDGETTANITSDMITEEGRTIGAVVTSAQLDRLTAVLEGIRTYRESVWTETQDLADGTEITLPDGISYIPGKHLIDLSWNGLVCFLGSQFEEIPAEEGNEKSDKIKILFDVPGGSEFRVLVRGHSSVTTSTDTAIIENDRTTVLERIANLETAITMVADAVAVFEEQLSGVSNEQSVSS